MGIRISRLQVWQRQYRGSRGTTRTATPGTRTGSSSFFSNIHMIHVYMPIFQWESEFRGHKGDKSHAEGQGEQWERQPQEPGQGVVHFFKYIHNNSLVLVPGVVVLMVHLDPQHGFFHPCNLNIRILIEKLSYKHVSYAYLKKMNYSLSWSLGLPFSWFTWTLDMAFVTLET